MLIYKLTLNLQVVCGMMVSRMDAGLLQHLRACSAAQDKLSTIALYGNNGIVSVASVVDDKKLLGAGTQTNDYSFGRDKTLSLPQCAVTS